MGPRRTSAVTTHFAALIGDMGLPAGTARRVTPRTQRSSRFLVTEHFISVRGGDQFEVRNHYLDILNTAGVCLFITAWLRMIEPLQRAHRTENRKKNICSEQSDFSNLPPRNTRSFDLRKKKTEG